MVWSAGQWPRQLFYAGLKSFSTDGSVHRHPDIFWIGYASSAVVQVQLFAGRHLSIFHELTHVRRDFWQYYEPIRENMPRNCSADVEAVIAYVDGVFTGNDTQSQRKIQRMFGFSSNLDVAQARGYSFVSNPLPNSDGTFSEMGSVDMARSAA